MRAIWNGFISFGLVTIPVAVGLAQQRRDVSFRTLSRESMTPVKQKRWDPERDVEVGPGDTVKGWEVAKGRYIPVEDDELERFHAQQEKTIEILQFVDLADVDPVYFERAYWLEPQERAERPYALLARAMERRGQAALGRFVLSTKEHLVLLRPFDGTLALETLYYPEDIRISDKESIAERLSGVEVRDEELAMAEQLIDGLAKPFEAERFPNETRRALLEYLEAKAEGQEPVIAEEAPRQAPVVDLMAALKASLAAVGGAAPEAGEGDGADAPGEPPLREVDGGGTGSGRRGGGRRGTAAAGASGAEEAAETRRSRKAS